MSQEGLERPKGEKIQAKAAQMRTEKASLPRAGSPELLCNGARGSPRSLWGWTRVL